MRDASCLTMETDRQHSANTAMAGMQARALHLRELDALRAVGVLLGIALHAAIPYMRGAVPELVWVVRDSRPSAIFDWLFWWLRAVQVPLFLLLSGFFAAAHLSRRDVAGFLRSRWRRLVLPLAAGIVLVLPLVFGVWAWGWLITGRCTWDDIRRMRFAAEMQRNLYGPAHLWFLEDLFIVSVMAACASTVSRALRRRGPAVSLPRFAGRVCASPWGILAIVASTIAVLSVRPDVVTTHRNTFVPIPWRIIYCATVFAGGIWLYRCRRALPLLASTGPPLLVLSIIPLASVVQIMRAAGSAPPLYAGRLALAASLALVTWLALSGLVGIAWRFGDAGGRFVRVLSAHAYWIYLVHLPIVGALQVSLLRVDWPAAAKFLVVAVATTIAAAGSGAAGRRLAIKGTEETEGTDLHREAEKRRIVFQV